QTGCVAGRDRGADDLLGGLAGRDLLAGDLLVRVDLVPGCPHRLAPGDLLRVVRVPDLDRTARLRGLLGVGPAASDARGDGGRGTDDQGWDQAGVHEGLLSVEARTTSRAGSSSTSAARPSIASSRTRVAVRAQGPGLHATA